MKYHHAYLRYSLLLCYIILFNSNGNRVLAEVALDETNDDAGIDRTGNVVVELSQSRFRRGNNNNNNNNDDENHHRLQDLDISESSSQFNNVTTAPSPPPVDDDNESDSSSSSSTTDCDDQEQASPTRIQTYFIVDLIGYPRELDAATTSQLTLSFLQAYNQIATEVGNETACISLISASIVDSPDQFLDTTSATNNERIVDDGRDFSLLMEVSGLCRGCKEGTSILQNVMASSSSDTSTAASATIPPTTRRRMQDNNTNITDANTTITNSPTASPSTTPPTTLPTTIECSTCEVPSRNRVIVQWKLNYDKEQQQPSSSITSIFDITELLSAPQEKCHPQNFSRFQTNAVVTLNTTTLSTSTSDLNLDDLSTAFHESYKAINGLNSKSCDPYYRRITQVSVPSYNNPSPESSVTFINFAIEGICQGCDKDNDDEFIDGILFGGGGAGLSSTDHRRRLQAEENNSTLCLCPVDADEKSPTLSQFRTEFTNVIKDLGIATSNITDDEGTSSSSPILEVSEVIASECSDEIVEFNQTGILLELDITDTDLCATTTDDQSSNSTSNTTIKAFLTEEDISRIEQAFVAAYNELAESFCDPHVRLLDSASLIRQQQQASEEEGEGKLIVTLEMNVSGRCRGCDPNDADFSIYVSFAETFPIADALKSSLNYNDDHDSGFHRRQRRLATCYCDIAAANQPRPPTESEFVTFLSKNYINNIAGVASDSETESSCVSSVVDCTFGTPFQTAIIASFANDTDIEMHIQDIEAAFIRSIGMLYPDNSEGTSMCHSEFRKFQSVDSLIGAPFQPRNFGLPIDENTRRRRQGRRRNVEKTPSRVEGRKRNLQQDGTVGTSEPSTKEPTSATISLRPSFRPTLAPTFNPTSTSPSEMPSLYPSSAPSFIDNDTYVLLYFNGVCNGCSGSSVISPTSSLQVPPSIDELGDLSWTSQCYCPIDAEEISGPYSADALESVVQNELTTVENVPLTVRNLYEVDLVECQGSIRNFESLLYVNFAVNSTLNQSETRMLSRLILETFQNLSGKYCDPFMRELDSLRLRRAVRLGNDDGSNSTSCSDIQFRYSASGVCQGCDNGTALLDEPNFLHAQRGLVDMNAAMSLEDIVVAPLSRRLRFAKDAVCFCDQEATASRAPSAEEFESALRQALNKSPLGKICTVSVPPQDIETSAPTASPTEEVCDVTLPNQLSSRVLVILQDKAGDLNLTTEEQQMIGDMIRSTYNSIIELRYTPCDLEYRLVSNVTVDEYFNATAPSGSVPFVVDVDCQGCGPDSDLFNPNVITRSNFETIFRRNIERNVTVAGIREIDLRSCPTDTAEFSRIIRIDFSQLPCMDGLNFTGTEPQLRSVEAAVVSTYNSLALSYCNPFYTTLNQAEIVLFGENTEEGYLPVQIKVSGTCRGCNPDTVDVYAIPNSPFQARMLVPNSMNWDGRHLQSVETCFCDSQSIGDRAPFESEFVAEYRKTVEALDLPCLDSVAQCDFGTRFSTGIVVEFERSELLESGNATVTIEETFQQILNELYVVDEESCNPEFRVVESVQAFIGVNITSGNTTTEQGGGDLRSLQAVTDFPTMSPIATNATESPDSPLILPDGPTSSPTFLFDVTATDTVSILLFVAGTCNGCSNDLSLSNQVTASTRRERQLSMKRELQVHQDEDSGFNLTSNCFCPIEATRQTDLTATAVTDSFQRALNNEVNLTVGEIEEINVVECIDDPRTFDMFFTFTFAVKPDISDSEIDDLSSLIQETYNDVNGQYCDPQDREIGVLLVNDLNRRMRKGRRRMQEGECFNLDIEFNAFGTCLGCDADVDLFDEDNSNRRRRRGLSNFDFDSAIVGNSRVSGGLRHLEQADICVCEGDDPIALRAPTFDEFASVFQSRLESLGLSNVCGFFEVESEFCDVTSLGDEFSASVELSVVVDGDFDDGDIFQMEEIFFNTFNREVASSVDTCDEDYSELYYVLVSDIYGVSRRLYEAEERNLQGFDFLNIVFDFFGFCQIDGPCDGALIWEVIDDISNAIESRVGPVVAASDSEDVFSDFENDFFPIFTFNPSFESSFEDYYYYGTFDPSFPPFTFAPGEDYNYYEGTEFPHGFDDYNYYGEGSQQPHGFDDYQYYETFEPGDGMGPEFTFEPGDGIGPEFTFEPGFDLPTFFPGFVPPTPFPDEGFGPTPSPFEDFDPPTPFPFEEETPEPFVEETPEPEDYYYYERPPPEDDDYYYPPPEDDDEPPPEDDDDYYYGYP